MPSTIRDVARKAGVSISTVSRVLNDTCTVAEDKRDRVQLAAQELGYVPNPAARALLNHRTGGLGILLPDVSGEFFSELLSGMDRVARDNDHFLLISTSNTKASQWRATVQSVFRRVDGLVVMAPQLTPEELDLGVDVGTVFINTPVGNPASSVDVINFDNRGASRAATEHLLALGHRSFVYVRGPRSAHDAAEREAGFLEAVRELNDVRFEIVQADYRQQDGYQAGLQIAKMDNRPTAVLAANDDSAVGILRAFQETGLRVPADISLVGFDDLASAQYSVPPLTTLSVPIRDIGRRAVQRLLDRLYGEKDSPGTHEVVPVQLIVRESTGPPAR